MLSILVLDVMSPVYSSDGVGVSKPNFRECKKVLQCNAYDREILQSFIYLMQLFTKLKSEIAGSSLCKKRKTIVQCLQKVAVRPRYCFLLIYNLKASTYRQMIFRSSLKRCRRCNEFFLTHQGRHSLRWCWGLS